MQTIRWTHSAFCLVVAAVLLPCAFGQLPASYTFTIYDVPGAVSTRIQSINNRGDITGTYVTADSVSHAFVRLADNPAVTTFTAPGGGAASHPVINSQGQIAFAAGINLAPGFGFSFTSTDVYLRSADGRLYLKLATISGDGSVTGMNSKAQVIGYAVTMGPDNVFLLNPDGSPPAIRLNHSRNYGINDAGQVIWVDNNVSRPFNATIFLDNPDGTASGRRLDVPYYVGSVAMSNTGLVAGTFVNTNFGHGFIGDLSTNLYVPLDVPDFAGLTQVNGVNDFGVVVGAVGPSPGDHGFIATPAATTPSLAAAGILNAASYSGASISPGEVVALFGAGLGPPAFGMAAVDASGTVAADILTARILVNGIPAPLIYARGSQVSAVIPYEVSGTTASIQAEFQGNRSLPVVVPVTPSTPGIFTLDSSGTGPGVILNRDGSINTVLNPAKRGDIIVIYATGFGQTLPAGATGKISGVNLPTVLQQPLPVRVMAGNSQARILYDGPAPAIIAGVTQINVIVPADAPFGATVPITVQVGDATSRAGVTVALK